jgi:hypothetical protein
MLFCRFYNYLPRLKAVGVSRDLYPSVTKPTVAASCCADTSVVSKVFRLCGSPKLRLKISRRLCLVLNFLAKQTDFHGLQSWQLEFEQVPFKLERGWKNQAAQDA